MSAKQVKRLEKILAKESQNDELKIKKAKEELEKAEKAHQKSIKVSYVASHTRKYLNGPSRTLRRPIKPARRPGRKRLRRPIVWKRQKRDSRRQSRNGKIWRRP